MRRREVLICSFLLPQIAVAQAKQAHVVIAVLRNPTPNEEISLPRTAAATLRDLGWTDGQNLRLEIVSAEGRLDRLPQMARDIVARSPTVIMTQGGTVTAALVEATRDLPIVMGTSAFDPVERGWAYSYGRPGRNLTGITFVADEAVDKQLELLKQAAPSIAHVGLLRTLGNESTRSILARAQATAPRLGLSTSVADVNGEEGVEPAVQALKSAGADALLPIVDPIMDGLRRRIAEVAIQHRMPSAAQIGYYASAGILVTYAADLTELHRRSTAYVDRILRGAAPGELPIERPTKFTFTLNLRTARAIGLDVPPSLLARADDVIE
jgi:putative ABC transport system substrate-binding protein